MRSKHIAALITFFVTFVFSAFIALLFAAPRFYDVPPVVSPYLKTYDKRCGKSVGGKIEEFLNQDKRNGLERRDFSDAPAAKSASERADSVSVYARKSGGMNANYLPREFQTAWNEHMKAWSDYAEFLQKSKYKGTDSEEFKLRQREYISDIDSTWQETLHIGREYGANLPADF